MFTDTTRSADTPRQTPAFVRDENGGILVFWALFLAVGFGFAALTFDIGRVANTQSELQSFADQVALAAAGELDGRADAIDRARDAANGLISRGQTFGDGNAVMEGQSDYTLRFLSSLPADDRAPATAVTTDPARARFVEVRVNQRNVQTPFAAINATLVGRAGANAQSQVNAAAVAGVAGYACDITPLFFCAPTDWTAKESIGQQILLRSGGAGAGWGPGNFGFLDPSDLPTDGGDCAGISSTAQLYRCLIGAQSPIAGCVESEPGIETKPGQSEGLVRGLNTRFDVFQGAMNSERRNPIYQPAPNVISDLWEGPAGNKVEYSDEPHLPRDDCFVEGTCSHGGRFGDGTWDRDYYLETFHDGAWPLQTALTSAPENFTRYELYLAEIEAARERLLLGEDWTLLSDPKEFGIPHNHDAAKNPENLDPDRRTIIAASVDCEATLVQGNTRVFPQEYVKMFMTEPMRPMSGSDYDKGALFVEVVESAGGVGNGSGAETGIYREVVQLYR